MNGAVFDDLRQERAPRTIPGMAPAELELRTVASIREIGENTWSELSRGAPPFLGYVWLEALENAGCVGADVGWLPLYLTLSRAGTTVAAAPVFVKGHSEGEFVFDHSWARFAAVELGIDYYPKLIVAVPFTPATGPRLLIRPGVEREPLLSAFARALDVLARRLGVSSAHVLFPTAEQAEGLGKAGLARRVGIQFHWKNAGYKTFDDFLSAFNAKRRHQIRRERRELEAQGVRVKVLTGSDLTPAIVDHAYDFYLATVDKFAWGRRYLNREFFEEVAARMGPALHWVFAFDGNKPIAGALNILGSRALYGRYWGALEERPFLHFNVCYYKGVEECIERGLDLFEPGAGGEHKRARGFEPALTHSAHLLVDPRLDGAVRDFLRRERAAVEAFSNDPASRVLKT